LRLDVDYAGAADADTLPVPPIWSPTPAAAAAHGLADALRRRSFWTSPLAGADDAGPAAADTGAGAVTVDVAAGSDEFRAVTGLFYGGGAAKGGRTGLRVVGVRRVENDTLRQLFVARQKHVARQCGGSMDLGRMERWLFHGPGNGAAGGSGDALACIVEEGFRPLLAGCRVGAAFGKGAMAGW
jgi:hypothetical protein